MVWRKKVFYKYMLKNLNILLKRCFDFIVALLGIIILLPVFILSAILIVIDSHGPVFYLSERIGKGLVPFVIYKFRTMYVGSDSGAQITSKSDSRITRVGKILRKTKIDELPNLINVLKGDMSFVGPRPEVKKFVDIFLDDYKKVLAVKPGITDLSSIEFRDEAELLETSDNVEQVYTSKILPKKLKYNIKYVERNNVLSDFFIIIKTLLAVVKPK